MRPTVLDSWLAIAADGTVTVFSSKVDLGTGVLTSLRKFGRRTRCALNRVHMETGDTGRPSTRPRPQAARPSFAAGPQLRQASAAARVELLKLASAHLNAPVEKLTVTDGVVSDSAPSNKISYGDLLGGKQFNIKIMATGVGGDMKVAPEMKREKPEGLQGRRDIGSARGFAGETYRRNLCTRRTSRCRACCTASVCGRRRAFPRPDHGRKLDQDFPAS